MSTPVWMLLAFAGWTVVLLLTTVGVYRWSRILTGREEIRSFRADRVEGAEWYVRAMRAHANCVENLPVFGAIVFALHAADAGSGFAAWLTIAVVVARILQSLTHVIFVQTNKVVSLRFAFFFAQIACFVWLMAIIVAGGIANA